MAQPKMWRGANASRQMHICGDIRRSRCRAPMAQPRMRLQMCGWERCIHGAAGNKTKKFLAGSWRVFGSIIAGLWLIFPQNLQKTIPELIQNHPSYPKSWKNMPTSTPNLRKWCPGARRVTLRGARRWQGSTKASAWSKFLEHFGAVWPILGAILAHTGF